MRKIEADMVYGKGDRDYVLANYVYGMAEMDYGMADGNYGLAENDYGMADGKYVRRNTPKSPKGDFNSQYKIQLST